MNALCLSGHIRNLNPSLRKFNGDIFIATWNNPEIDSIQKTDVDYIQEMLNPKKILIENYHHINNLHKTKYEKVKNHVQYQATFHKNRQGWDSYSMWYLIKKAGEMKRLYELENEFKYNIVTRFRPDFSFSESPKEVKENTLYFPSNSNYKGITDNCFSGTSEIMDVAFMMYDLMDCYVMRENCEWVNEKLFFHHLQRFGITIENPNNFNYNKEINQIPFM